MKKSKLFAPFLMLLAGAIASIMMYYFQYTTKQMLPRLVIVLVVFYLIGCFTQKKVKVIQKNILLKRQFIKGFTKDRSPV